MNFITIITVGLISFLWKRKHLLWIILKNENNHFRWFCRKSGKLSWKIKKNIRVAFDYDNSLTYSLCKITMSKRIRKAVQNFLNSFQAYLFNSKRSGWVASNCVLTTCLRPTQLCGGRPTKRKLFNFLLLAHSLLR